jgi:hypothetical protein
MKKSDLKMRKIALSEGRQTFMTSKYSRATNQGFRKTMTGGRATTRHLRSLSTKNSRYYKQG